MKALVKNSHGCLYETYEEVGMKTMRTKKAVSVSLSEDLDRSIEYLVSETRLSKSFIVQSAIENGIEPVRAHLLRLRSGVQSQTPTPKPTPQSETPEVPA
jgi:predicted DNA-binding protein